ncbi:hypothetical protein [Oceanospirillum maris]|uniref:hypothetical protein n=1 Tax=Oceanospirillum maris TaxID=64977 RepID=UPI00041D214A|nr:hypothetical protein [Oceanospirillum maris]
MMPGSSNKKNSASDQKIASTQKEAASINNISHDPSSYYGLRTWFSLAQGDEALLVRILADTAGLKGWLSRPLHDQLSQGLLEDVAEAGVLESFDRAAVYLLSQMPQFTGPAEESHWLQWLSQWQTVYKDKTPVEQLDRLPERFDHAQAEKALQVLLKTQQQTAISVTLKD